MIHDPPPLSARALILDLLDTGAPPDFSTGELVQAGAALGLEATAIRTALTRLRQEGRVRTLDRGRHTIGARAAPLQQRIQGWRRVEARRQPWAGGWLLAIAGPQDRADRTVWRHTMRALDLEGFVEAETNVWARPDNLAGGPLIRDRLRDLDAAPNLLVVAASGLDEARTARFPALWPVAALQAAHGQRAAALAASAARLPDLPLAAAAAESLLTGRAAIRAILRDPLLPEALCPPAALSALIAAMDDYDRRGKAIWARYLAL
ncbi:hypothetical protein [Zavarzinia compransoris]|uniref:Transcriptional repressor PaaX-like N-terminal domain-containing protein n=1 Tax=Zavarzinia compransoris TaxID=1264899 RepID=A0A317E7U1_9PROT|nr:hypothetical protein [Zavarzinia compransoris]PWR23009.1 hypothetical protein DKG75_00050 [Zavarzinia compransoris]TDP46448.1 PaaX family transcriptional regulator [Zavarzinia compransoris]